MPYPSKIERLWLWPQGISCAKLQYLQTEFIHWICSRLSQAKPGGCFYVCSISQVSESEAPPSWFWLGRCNSGWGLHISGLRKPLLLDPIWPLLVIDPLRSRILPSSRLTSVTRGSPTPFRPSLLLNEPKAEAFFGVPTAIPLFSFPLCSTSPRKYRWFFNCNKLFLALAGFVIASCCKILLFCVIFLLTIQRRKLIYLLIVLDTVITKSHPTDMFLNFSFFGLVFLLTIIPNSLIESFPSADCFDRLFLSTRMLIYSCTIFFKGFYFLTQSSFKPLLQAMKEFAFLVFILSSTNKKLLFSFKLFHLVHWTLNFSTCFIHLLISNWLSIWKTSSVFFASSDIFLKFYVYLYHSHGSYSYRSKDQHMTNLDAFLRNFLFLELELFKIFLLHEHFKLFKIGSGLSFDQLPAQISNIVPLKSACCKFVSGLQFRLCFIQSHSMCFFHSLIELVGL